MHIQINNAVINQQNNLQQGDKLQKMDGPPPPGKAPPGLEEAIGTLSDEEQDDVSTMLANLTEEQQQSLKSALDDLKSLSDSLTKNDMGVVFLESLTQISNSSVTSSKVEGIDTYA